MTQIFEKKTFVNTDFLRLDVSSDLKFFQTTKDNFDKLSSSRFENRLQSIKNTKNFDDELIQELSYEVTSKIESLIKKISNYLDQQFITYKITRDIISDPEYPDWRRVKIGIKISKDVNFIHENLKKPIYNIINESIPQEFEDKILLKLEKL